MSRYTLPVIAAIPNYNMGSSLEQLLPQILEQEYQDVFVLDDASSDHSREVVDSFKDVLFVAGTENIGAGGNRNRIIPILGQEAIIHFIDADMELETERTPELIKDIMPEHSIGFMGGLVKNPNGRQMGFNYGPRQCLRTDLTGLIQFTLCGIGEKDPEREKNIRARLGSLLDEWPNPTVQPEPRKVFFASEANLLINSKILEGAGGFDPSLRDHDIQDLAIRTRHSGLKNRFDPSLAATHKAINVRPGNRRVAQAKAEAQIIRKFGLLNWLIPEGGFKPKM